MSCQTADDRPPSPCIGLCRMGPDGVFCRGCWRTLDEIAAWTRMGAAAREAVLAQLPDRRAALDTQGARDVG